MPPSANLYLSRKTVLVSVGNWRRLRALEAAKKLRRYYPAGLKHARYLKSEVEAATAPAGQTT